MENGTYIGSFLESFILGSEALELTLGLGVGGATKLSTEIARFGGGVDSDFKCRRRCNFSFAAWAAGSRPG
jgi:hypothetical protein